MESKIIYMILGKELKKDRGTKCIQGYTDQASAEKKVEELRKQFPPSAWVIWIDKTLVTIGTGE